MGLFVSVMLEDSVGDGCRSLSTIGVWPWRWTNCVRSPEKNLAAPNRGMLVDALLASDHQCLKDPLPRGWKPSLTEECHACNPAGGQAG